MAWTETYFGEVLGSPTVIIVMLAGLGLVGWIIVGFNRLVRDRALLREGWSGIDVQLKRRHNLVPALLECVKGYAAHEKNLLLRVTELRSADQQTDSRQNRREVENALTDQIKQLFAVAEDYPDIKADRNFIHLQEQLAEIEDQIQYARRYYNGAVRNYNIRVASFPSNCVAKIFGFRREEFFEIEIATERNASVVEI
ncbi:MAG: LemA family protein [Phycisphaerae bacterium]|nr:LemA family protein [Phycisphaerae bacterium]